MASDETKRGTEELPTKWPQRIGTRTALTTEHFAGAASVDWLRRRQSVLTIMRRLGQVRR